MNAPNDTPFLTRHYIDGRWVDGTLGRTIAVVNPATGVHLAERLDDSPGEEVSIPSAGHLARIRREPCGVAALIVPWNFPMVTTAWKLAPALAAGCATDAR